MKSSRGGGRTLVMPSALAGMLLLLAACAEEPAVAPSSSPATTTLPEPAALPAPLSRAALEGMPPAAPLSAVSAGELNQALSARRESLAQLLQSEVIRGLVTAPEQTEDAVRFDWRSDALFEIESAQLQPQALAPLGRLAAWLRADGRVVLHVLAYEPRDRSDALADRRAAAIVAFLVSEGASAARVRGQAEIDSQLPDQPSVDAARLDQPTIGFVVQPVVEGRAADAWTPP